MHHASLGAIERGDIIKISWDPSHTPYRVHDVAPDGGIIVYNARGNQGVLFPGEVEIVTKKDGLAVGDRVRFPGMRMTYEVIDILEDVGGYTIRTEDAFRQAYGESETRTVSADEVELLPSRRSRGVRGIGALMAYPYSTRIESLNYGEMPEQTVFRQHFQTYVGSGNYTMELVGGDLEAMQDAFGDPRSYTSQGKGYYEFDWQNLYMVLQSLIEEGDNAADEWGQDIGMDEISHYSLASSILTTLGFEWI